MDERKVTPDKVLELFRIAEDWNDIRQIMVNVNYYVGNQWIGWNRSERKIQMLPVYEGQERITLNKIRPRVNTLLAKHTKNRIKFDVIPASKEEQDMDTAKAANKYLQFMWQELDFTTKTRDIFLNMLIKKRCWVKTWFDKDAGDDITPSEGQTGYEKDMQPIHMGKICARVCDPLTIFADPSATTEDEIRWIVERKARDVDEIEEEYGKKVDPDGSIDYLNSYDLTRVSSDGIASNEVARKRNMALVYELWMKPCKKYPKGLKVTMAGGQELDYDDAAGDMPYHLFGYIPIPGNLMFDAIVTDMIPVQRGINIKRSMIATHAKRVGNTMWLLPLGSNVDEEDLTNEEGGFVYYNPTSGMKPERAMAPDIPSFYDRDLANDAVDLDDMSGSREVSQGRMPKGLDTLGGLQIMVEQENEKLTVGASNYEQAMKKVKQRLLKLMKMHYTEERQGRILGEDNEIELISFNASKLTNEDITVIQGSSLPEMKAAQQERIMLMWDKGAIQKRDGMPDANKLLRLMDMGDSTELFEQYQLDENNAKLENKTFEDFAADPQYIAAAQQYIALMQQTLQALQAQQIPPEQIESTLPQPPPGTPQIWSSDDDEVHIEIHNTFRKTGRYRNMDPTLRAMVDQHYQEHVDRLNAPMMAQQRAEMAAQGKEAEAGRQHQTELKKMDHDSNMQRDFLKAETTMATAAMKGVPR